MTFAENTPTAAPRRRSLRRKLVRWFSLSFVLTLAVASVLWWLTNPRHTLAPVPGSVPSHYTGPHAREGFGVFFLVPESQATSDELVISPPPGLAWTPSSTDSPDPLIVLIHGLDEPGEIWDELAPQLHAAGYRVARFEYPNDQAISDSASLLVHHLELLRSAGTRHVSIVAHSMGGLVARDALTRPDRDPSVRPDVDRLITVGTPNHGSSWVRGRIVGEARERAVRLYDRARHGRTLFPESAASASAGQAGADLLPDSLYLRELNSRPLPGTPITLIYAAISDAAGPATDALGDGVVSVDSARLDGVSDVVLLEATHRSMLRTLVRTPDSNNPPPAFSTIFSRLAKTYSR